jgi:hypothetical protein
MTSLFIIQVEGRLNAIIALATGAEARRSMLMVERVKGIGRWRNLAEGSA